MIKLADLKSSILLLNIFFVENSSSTLVFLFKFSECSSIFKQDNHAGKRYFFLNVMTEKS